MPWSGSGVFNLDPSYSPEVNGTVIDALRYNGLTTDIAAGITNALTKDGQNVPTANIPMGGFKLTGLAAGTAAGHSVRYEQANIIGETSVTGNATLADIFATPTARVLFDGTGLTITAFPASSLNTWKIVRFNGTNTITHGASLICPSGGNITTATGDYALMVSVGSTTVIVDYFPVAGRNGRISNLLSATAANTLTNGDFAQAWNWSLTTASKTGLAIGESSASTGADSILLSAAVGVTSTASPFLATAATLTGNLSRFGYVGNSVYVVARNTASASGSVSIEASASNGAVGPGTITIAGGASNSVGAIGGVVQINGGNSNDSRGGSVQVQVGNSDSTTSGALLLTGGPLAVATNSTAKPSVTGAGTGSSVTGSDGCFVIDVGTSASTTITVTFSRPMGASGSKPRVFVQYEGVSTLDWRLSSVTTTSFDIIWNAAPAATAFIHCLVIPTSAAIA